MCRGVFSKIRQLFVSILIGIVCGGAAAALTLPLILFVLSEGNSDMMAAGWSDLPRYAAAGMFCGFLGGTISGICSASFIRTALIAAGAAFVGALLLPVYSKFLSY